jgi:hypothetical protein
MAGFLGQHSLVGIASFVMAYIFLAQADFVTTPNIQPERKNALLGKKLMFSATWPYGHVRRTYLGNPPVRRGSAVAVAILKIAASWLFMSFMFSLAIVAVASLDNELLRDAAFVVLCSLLLPVASLVSPAGKAFLPRKNLGIRFPWHTRRRTHQGQVADASGSNIEQSSDESVSVEAIELLVIQAKRLGWKLHLPDHNNLNHLLLSYPNLVVSCVRGNEKATLWTKLGKITLLRSDPWPAFGDFLELEKWIGNHPESLDVQGS